MMRSEHEAEVSIVAAAPDAVAAADVRLRYSA